MRTRLLSFAAVILCVFMYATDRLFGQAVSGAITGYAYDPSNAPVVGATVTVKNVDTGVTTTRTTDSTGLYLITNLSPATYSVMVEASGFRRFVQENVVLRVDSTMRIDGHLEIGELTQEVTVSAAPPMLKTEKTDVGQAISEHEVQSLPTVGRNLSNLYNLTPGVVQNFFQIGAGENPSEFNGTLVNGQFFGNSEYEIDGITDTAYGFSGFQVIVPTQESVQEMKITTASYDPEFGSSAGMVAQYVTKSGTNDIHGSAFYFHRNSATFAADPFTEKIAGTGKDGKGFGPAPFKWHQGGFSLGGPLKKNRMFLFGDYQLTRNRQGAALTATVPNDAFRIGDFSALASTNPIFDPLTGNPDGTGRLQFSCNGVLNVICPDRINPVAKNLLGLLPRANLSQETDVNFVGGGTTLFDQDQFTIRFDANLSDKDKFFGRYTYLETLLDNPPLFGTKAGGLAVGGLSPQTGDTRSQHIALNYTHTFGASLLAEGRLGLVRFRLDGYQADADLRTNDEVGIPNINTGDRLTGGLAGIDVFGPVGAWFMGIRSGVGIPRLDRSTAIQAVNNWTKVQGSHQFRWGVDLRRNRFDFLAVNASSRGNFQFSQTVTGNADVAGSGLGMATFLLGLPSRFDRAIFTIFPAERQTRLALYWQDIWRATPKLTVNYGVRWDYFGPVTPGETGGLVNWDPDTGDLILAGLGDVSRSANVRVNKDNFSPRLGIAYKLTQKSVIRAGFGRTYFGGNYDSVFYHLTSAYPIVAQQTISQTSIYQGLFPIQQGPPASPPPEFPASGHLKPPTGTLIKPRPFDWATEQIDSWNLTLEHQLAQDFRVSVAYVGNVGRHLAWGSNINAAPPGVGPLLNRRPYYQKFGLDTNIANVCNCMSSNYNSLQVVAEKRFSKGYSFNSSYTWAKALDRELGGFGWDDQDVNPYDAEGSYGVSTYNRASVWTMGHTWQLPYGKGTPYGSDATGVKKALLAGWNFNGITTVESGFAISPRLDDRSTSNADFAQRPNAVPGADLYAGGRTRDRWFNPAAFVAPAACCIWGNAGRGTIRGPGLISADWSFWKEFDFRERFKIQFRWENFNFFNNTNLGAPVNFVDRSTAGRITSLAGAGAGFGYVPMRRMQFGLRLSW
jgi:Carboxypeptidase regulatory-like domain